MARDVSDGVMGGMALIARGNGMLPGRIEESQGLTDGRLPDLVDAARNRERLLLALARGIVA